LFKLTKDLSPLEQRIYEMAFEFADGLVAAGKYALLLMGIFGWRNELQAASGKAMASVVLGFLSFSVSVVAGIPAAVLAILGMQEIKRSAGRLRGRGLAITGMTAAIVGMVGPPIAGALILPSVRQKTAKMQSSNNLKLMALGMMDYESRFGKLPPAVLRGPTGQLYSWRVALLPYLGEEKLYANYNLNEPWDSPGNRAVLARMPRFYAPPGMAGGNSTFYQVVVGRGTAFESPDVRLSPWRDRDFPKGAARTLMIVEAESPVPWTKPEDLTYAPGQPLPELGGIFHDGFHVAFVDGSVQWVKRADAGQVGQWVTRTR
jgi:hypothetical protein